MSISAVVPVFCLVLAGAPPTATPTSAPPTTGEKTAPASFADEIHKDVEPANALVQTPWVRTVFARAQTLPPRPMRRLWKTVAEPRAWRGTAPDPKDAAAWTVVELADDSYYSKGSSPLSYTRLFDLAARQGGLDGVSGKTLVDYGYGDIGHLQVLSLAGAHAVGVDVLPMLPLLYNHTEDFVFAPGTVRLIDGRYPKDPVTRFAAGSVDVFLSKNTLKRGYIRPEPPVSTTTKKPQTVNPKHLIDLGVERSTFLKETWSLLKPGGLFVIYNISPAPAPLSAEAYVPWGDGRSAFDRAEFVAAGFDVIAFDVVDNEAVRALAHALRWDQGEDKVDLERDLFAWYTLVRKPASPKP